jgi:hypothetical protein
MTLAAATPPPARCPRCQGRLATARDWAGRYSSCFVCGYMYEWCSEAAITLTALETETLRQRRREPTHGKVRL